MRIQAPFARFPILSRSQTLNASYFTPFSFFSQSRCNADYAPYFLFVSSAERLFEYICQSICVPMPPCLNNTWYALQSTIVPTFVRFTVRVHEYRKCRRRKQMVGRFTYIFVPSIHNNKNDHIIVLAVRKNCHNISSRLQ